MVKRCQWGLCKSDSRYPDRLDGGIKFIPFPKPKRQLDKCKRWIKACGRPHSQLNPETVDGNYQLYVCTKHFPEGNPSEAHPDPVPADPTAFNSTPARRPPRRRPGTEPLPRKRKILTELDMNSDETAAKQKCESIHQLNQTDSRLSTDHSYSARSLESNEINNIHLSEQTTAMEILALAAENKRLQQQLAKQVLVNEDLRRENSALKDKDKKSTKENNQPRMFTVESVRDSPVTDNFKYYTGFVFVQFLAIFKFLVPNKYDCPINFRKTISSIKDMKLEDQFLLTLIKLRLNLDFKHIATLFHISNQDAGSLFRTWINYMYYRFASVPIWPDRNVIKSKMPAKFHEDFPDTLIILDGTEIRMERPSALRSQSQCYSDYKSANTLKGLVGIDPRGSFIFISMLFSGSISDKEITAKSGLLDLLQQLLDSGKIKKGDGVMVDKGFLIKDEIEKLGLKLYIPPFASCSGQMPFSDVSLTRKIAKHRVHVERAISRAKKFKIVDNRMDLSLFPCVNQIWFNCCFLTNFMPYLIQD